MDILYRSSASLPANLAKMAVCLCLGLLVAGCGQSPITKGDDVSHSANPMFNQDYSAEAEIPFVREPKSVIGGGSRRARFDSESASRRTRDMADWVVSSRDNLDKPFAIVDKVNAKVFVFDAEGQLRGAAPVLLGLAKGDYSDPGVGDKPMSLISPSERTTPAGRFLSQMGRSPHGKEILWLDYKDAISMHPVVTNRPKERRLQRLESPSPLDNRISFGCINVPLKFFNNVIHGTFSGTVGIVYVLPEDRRARQS